MDYQLIKPLIFRLPAEAAHSMAIRALKLGLTGVVERSTRTVLKQRLWNLDFQSPIGLAAGFDKNAEVPDAILKLGFGFTECGTITPKPQAGNPKPRIFRLIRDRAVINRLGFNNKGLEEAASRLEERKRQGCYGIVGANVGANKTSEDHIADYVTCLDRLAGLAQYFVVNISSPNTPGLRALQSKQSLTELVTKVLTARNKAYEERNLGTPAPLLVKVAPDLTPEDIADIAAVAIEQKLDGLIISNTTIERPETLKGRKRKEAGGLSGAPLFEPSTHVLSEFYRLTEGKVPLIGVGGVSNAEQALEKIKSGASLVQIYSALVYEGPKLAAKIADDLALLLKAQGYSNIRDAVGANHREQD